MPQTSTPDDQLNRWIAVVDRSARRTSRIDQTLRGGRTGPWTLPLRFVFKVMEIGPIGAIRVAWSVITERLGLR